jgi:hypothetical protein
MLPGSPLQARRSTWRTRLATVEEKALIEELAHNDGPILERFVYDLGAMRTSLSKRPGDAQLRAWSEKLPDHFESELLDVFLDSIYAIDLLIDAAPRVQPGVPVITAKPRLEIEPKASMAMLDGTPYQMARDQVIILTALMAKCGNWVSGTELRDLPGLRRRRIDRIIEKLPCPILDLIESKPGAGYRLVLE